MERSKAYYQLLSDDDKAVYRQKCEVIDFVDPYLMEKDAFTRDVESWPSVTYFDIVNYLVYSPNPMCSMQDMKAYKSLEAHNHFTSGWVKDVEVANYKGIFVIRGRVAHSQSIRQTPPKLWIILRDEEGIVTANCDCKAGLGATCSHAAAVLFYLEGATKIRESRTVTEEKAYWLLPGGVRDVHPAPIRNIDFSSSSSKRRRLSQQIDGESVDDVPQLLSSDAPLSSEFEQQQFFKTVNSQGRKTAVLSVTAPFNERFMPEVTKDLYPRPLTHLMSGDCSDMNRDDLQQHCDNVEIAVNSNEAAAVESATKTQAKSKLWYTFRAGRITASRMKAVCHTSLHRPSLSLVRAICYPEQCAFSTAATAWGCQHESEARDIYAQQGEALHIDFKITESGLIINPEFPAIGATPDACVSCSCCGSGVLEVKCPVCVSDPTQHGCLKEGKLDRKHQYFYQVQTQLFVSQTSYADFMIWTESGFHSERITPDTDFWQDAYGKASLFFRRVLLPELCGRYFTRNSNKVLSPVKRIPINQPQGDANATKWCLCRGEEILPMIACDNENCSIEWFHFKCVGIKRQRKGKWFCPNCRPQKKKKISEK